MQRWAPDAQLREVVRISPAAAVVHASYPLPAPLDARDVVMYRVSLAGDATRLAGCVRAAVAVSIDHNLVGPPPKGTVRAELIISATCFNAVPGQPSCTRVVSYQQVDPRGRLPPALVNRGVGAGTSSLRAVRDDLDALAVMEARMAKAQKKGGVHSRNLAPKSGRVTCKASRRVGPCVLLPRWWLACRYSALSCAALRSSRVCTCWAAPHHGRLRAHACPRHTPRRRALLPAP